MSQPTSRQVSSSMVWSALRVWGNRLGGLLIFLILARLLNPSDFGVYAVLWAILYFVELFADLGLGDALIQREEIDQALINSVFVVNLGLALGIYLLIWFAALPVCTWFGSPEIAFPLQVAAVALIFNALGYCQLALCRRSFAYRWLAVRSLAATVISGSAGVVIAFEGHGYWALVVQFVAMAFINLVFLWLKPSWLPTMSFSFLRVRSLFRYSFQLTGSRILEASATRLFELGIGAMLGAAALGIYSVGSRIVQIAMQMLSNVVLDVAHSTLSRLANDRVRLRETYYQGLSLTAMVAVPIFVMLAALAPELCVVLFGLKWVESAPVLHAIALFGALQSLQYMNGAALNATGHSGKNLVMSLPKVFVSGMALFYASPYGVVVLAQSFAIGSALFSPLSFFFAKYVVDFSWPVLLRRILPFLTAAGVAYAAIEFARNIMNEPVPSISVLIILSSVAFISYVSCLMVIAPNHLKLVISFLSSHKKK